MHTLAVDFGNTSIKAASFENHRISMLKIFNSVDELVNDNSFLAQHSHAVIGSVTQQHLYFIESAGAALSCYLFKNLVPYPVSISYETPDTLGEDRLAAAIGAAALYPGKPVLSIDCGTCIKYNLVNQNAVFEGGAISPGLRMRFKALHHFTDKLPLVEPSDESIDLIGKSTANSILSGVIIGASTEIDGVIQEYKNRIAELVVVITGGDAPFFAKRLKNKIFAQPNLVLTGMDFALTHYIEKNS